MICTETRNRIRLSVAAWAYERHDHPIMSDAEFDHLALSIDLNKSTSRPDLDDWWRDNFNPSTGMWVLRHPESEGLERIYQTMHASRTRWEVLLQRLLERSGDSFN